MPTRCSGCSKPCERHVDSAGVGAGLRRPGRDDQRRSFDRLSAQVQEVLRQDPLSGHVFVFFNRQRNRVKLLVWEGDGFWLLYKRLEAGSFAVLEREEINARELYLLLEGIEVIRERRRYTR